MGVRALLSALPVLVKKQAQEQAYRIYVTDALKAITENTSKYFGGNYMKVRYSEIESPKPVETRTGKEVIEQMRTKIARIGGGDAESV